MMHEIRWQQRYENFMRALSQLESAVLLGRQRAFSDLEVQGVIQAFEYTHELAWHVMKDYFTYQGNPNITGSRDAVREAFSKGLIEDGEGWIEMIKSRNKTSHSYNQSVANEMIEKIMQEYFLLFEHFAKRMQLFLVSANK